MDAFQVVDRFLRNRWRVTLEDALCDGCLSGAVPTALEDDLSVMRRCTHVETHEDGGQSLTFEGAFVLMGVRYRFRCYLFVDPSGQRFLSHIAEFEAIEWTTQAAM
ncbi:MAG TPA: hypothetical protein VMV19_15580 [Xanthobacteraceae bacterium]|nr:hypothetical protein [Xanthobacteraceae bacterium]